MKKMILKVTSICFFTFLIMSCNKNTSKTTDENGLRMQTDKITAVFPHEKDFYKSHGANYLENKEQCLGCHGKDGSGGTAKVSCLQCHEVYPHVSFLGVPDQHAASYAKNPQACAKCHGDDWNGGKSNVSCLKCHENFPHPKKWADPSQHGKAFVAEVDKQKCLTCHDSKKPEAISSRCETCHQAFPGPHYDKKSFMTSGNKVHASLASSYEGKCLLCHRDYKENMPTLTDPDEGVGCFNCHNDTEKLNMQWIDNPKPAVPISGDPSGAISKLKYHKAKSAQLKKISVRQPTNTPKKNHLKNK